MTDEAFKTLCNDLLINERVIFDWKAADYTDADHLQNFKEVAAFLDMRSSEVALTYLLKHIQSISLAVRRQRYNWGWETKDGEGLKQRIADARNYLLLLAACIEEEVKSNEVDR